MSKRGPTGPQRHKAGVNASIQRLIAFGCLVAENKQGAGMVKFPSGAERYITWGLFKGEGADILGFAPGGWGLAVEFKVPPDKPSKEQLDFLRRVARLGGIALVVYDDEDTLLPDLKAALLKKRSKR